MSDIEPTVSQRGFNGYATLRDSYGADVKVYESSAASGPHVWISIEGGAVRDNKGSSHLNEEQATLVRDALTYWLDEIPGRWEEWTDNHEAPQQLHTSDRSVCLHSIRYTQAADGGWIGICDRGRTVSLPDVKPSPYIPT